LTLIEGDMGTLSRHHPGACRAAATVRGEAGSSSYVKEQQENPLFGGFLKTNYTPISMLVHRKSIKKYRSPRLARHGAMDVTQRRAKFCPGIQ